MRLAQLDRASDYGSEGREFESSIARNKKRKASLKAALRFFFLPVYETVLSLRETASFQPFLKHVTGKRQKREAPAPFPADASLCFFYSVFSEFKYSLPRFLLSEPLRLLLDQFSIIKVVDLHGGLNLF